MPNPENLIPNENRTPNERRKNAQKAGIASGEARRKRKTFKEQLLIMLETDGLQDDILNALTRQARRGNIKAFEVVRDTIGEKPVENVPETDDIKDDPLTESLKDLAGEMDGGE